MWQTPLIHGHCTADLPGMGQTDLIKSEFQEIHPQQAWHCAVTISLLYSRDMTKIIHQAPHLRPAEIGDICLLIEPHPQADTTALRTRQQTLHQKHGGKMVRHVHLSCQRILAAEEGQVCRFIELLTHGMRAFMPFPLHATALHTLSVPVLETTTLKWQVAITPTLRRFNTMVNDALDACDLATLYAPNFTSNLVSALSNIPPRCPQEKLQDRRLPYHLFDAAKIVLSQIRGPNDFAILARLS